MTIMCVQELTGKVRAKVRRIKGLHQHANAAICPTPQYEINFISSPTQN